MTAVSTAPLADTKLTRVFKSANEEGRPAIMPFMTVGWPELGDTERLIPAMIRGGADLIEVGLPFSDPIADGPTVQRVNQRALENGVTTRMAMEVVGRLRDERGVEAPLLFMGYFNPILAYGLEDFARDCARVGIDGVIVPDLPPEESDELLAACVENGIHLIYLLAPTSTPERVDAVLKRANGFIYLVSLVGVTGARDRLWEGLAEYAARVRQQTELPLALGFGISNREHVERAAAYVDGIIFASALLDHLEKTPSSELESEAERFVREMSGR